jgi:hypothetical protein
MEWIISHGCLRQSRRALAVQNKWHPNTGYGGLIRGVNLVANQKNLRTSTSVGRLMRQNSARGCVRSEFDLGGRKMRRVETNFGIAKV